MPPKSKEKKGKKKKPEVEVPVVDAAPTPPDPADGLLGRANQIADLTHEYAVKIDALQTDAQKRDEDTLDMVHYLEQEVDRKENANAKLEKHLQDLEEKQIADRKEMKERFQGALEKAERLFLQKEAQLQESNAKLRKQVEGLAEYKQMRAELAKDLNATKTTITENERRHRHELDELERTFLAARDHLEREAAQRIAQSRKVYKEEVGAELDEDSKRVREENKTMERELNKQEHMTDRLQAANLRLQQDIQKLKIELDLIQHKNKEYKKRHASQNEHVAEVQQKVKKYEATVTKLLREVETEREALYKKFKMTKTKLEFTLQDLIEQDGAREQELKELRVHAKTVLQQRQEVEKYFLNAIAAATERQRSFRKLKLQSSKISHNRKMRALVEPQSELRLPPIPNDKPFSAEEEYMVDGVDLRYDTVYRLTGMVRLQLLRLLYSKINNSKSAQQLPHKPHSFAIDIDSTGQIVPIPRRRKKYFPLPQALQAPEAQQQLQNHYSDAPSFFITDSDHSNPQQIM